MRLTCYLKYKTLLFNTFIISIIFYLLIHSNILIHSISQSINIFINKLVPSLFPYLLITELLINSGKINNLSYGLSRILSKLFRIPQHTTSVVIVGFLLGYPNAAKYILKLHKNGQIDSRLATKLMAFTSNANPSYIIASLGIGMFKSMEIGIILAASHILSAIFIGLFFTYSCNNNIIQQITPISNSFQKIYAPFELLYMSILGSLKTLAFIFSYTVIFSLIPSITFDKLMLPATLKSIITGIFEISNGINSICSLNLDFNFKITITSFILSFSSLMIIFQIYSFVFKTNVKLKELLKYKLLHGVISCIITYITITYIYVPIAPTFITQDLYVSSYNVSPHITHTIIIFIVTVLALILFKKKRHGKPVA